MGMGRVGLDGGMVTDTPQRGFWKAGIVYGLGPFRYATPESAPMVTPHTEAGAVGSVAITDTGSKLSATGGYAVSASVTGANDPLLVSPASYARVAGRTFMVRLRHPTTTPAALAGWSNTSNGLGNTHSIYVNGANIGVFIANTLIAGLATLAAATDYDTLIVLRAAGAFYFIKGGAYATWTLWWVDSTVTTSPLYAVWLHNGGAAAAWHDNLGWADLAGALATDTGLATTYKATTIDGDTATMTPDALLYHTITAQTGVTQELKFRITDANNYWLLRAAPPGTNTVKVIEVVATVETERASAAQTFTNTTTYRLGVIAAGANIASFVGNTVKGSYGGAATGLSATGVSVSHAGAKLECWPRNPSLPAGV